MSACRLHVLVLVLVLVLAIGACGTGEAMRASSEHPAPAAGPPPAIVAPSTVPSPTTAPATVPWPDGELVAGLDPLGLVATRPPTAWVPDTTVPLDEALPVPWAITSVTLDPEFNPYVYRLDAGMLCAAAEARPESEPMLEEIAGALVDRLLDHSVVVDGARFVEYRFPYQYEDLQLESPWVSAFGNAEAVLGTIALDRCWPTPRLDGVIDELLRAFERTEDDGGPWFRRDLTDGVWFEEIAVSGTEVMVLNGHLEAVLSLYYAWDRDPADHRLEELLHGGIRATVAHLPSYRRPGEVLCYDLTPPCHPDYGPVRTINQLHALAQVAPTSDLRGWGDLVSADLALATVTSADVGSGRLVGALEPRS